MITADVSIAVGAAPARPACSVGSVYGAVAVLVDGDEHVLRKVEHGAAHGSDLP